MKRRKARTSTLRFSFGPEDPVGAVWLLLQTHRGAAQAITIQQIGLHLWPMEWNNPVLRNGIACYPDRDDVQRQIKGVMSKLKRAHKGQIGVSRSSGGYYLISNDEELRTSLLPYYDQAVTMLRTVAEQTGMDLFVPELCGKRAQLANVTAEAPRR